MQPDQTYVYFPRGFRVLSLTESGDHAYYRGGHEQVNDLFDRYRSNKLNRQSIDDISELLDLTTSLIPGINRFFYWQSTNPFLSENNYEYLWEIKKFIEQGRHALSPLSAIELMDDPAEKTIVSSRQYPCVMLNAQNEQKPSRLNDYVARWIEHRGGFEDMVCTLYVLFGKSRFE